MKQKARPEDYPFLMRRLTAEEGGGVLIEFPDLPGCISDGDTEPETITNGRDAAASYLRSLEQHDARIPDPSPSASSSG